MNESSFRRRLNDDRPSESSFRRRPNVGNFSQSSSSEAYSIDYNHKSEYQRMSSSKDVKVANRAKPLHVSCGELRTCDENMIVHMRGRAQVQKAKRYIALRDPQGTTQLVVLEERPHLQMQLCALPIDSTIEIIGVVKRRESKNINIANPTGKIEVFVEEVLNVEKRKFDKIDDDGDNSGSTSKKARAPRVIPLTPKELQLCEMYKAKERFQERTHHSKLLNISDCNRTVILCGWTFGEIRQKRFGTLRDGYGSIQLILQGNDIRYYQECFSKKDPTSSETLVQVTGRVQARPNHSMKLGNLHEGEVEIVVLSIKIINKSNPEDSQEKNGSNLQPSEQSFSEMCPGDLNRYCVRTHTCGQLQSSDLGKYVVLYGWMERLKIDNYFGIRDGYGSTQVYVPSEAVNKQVAEVTPESVIMICGTVCARPPDKIIKEKPTGEIEVLLKEFKVINPATEDIPFIILNNNRHKENVRMKYRYIDLRFEDMQYKLRLRSKVLMKMREFLINDMGFVEVETPTLFIPTPGGVQEYVVPTRTEGMFYSLVDSPQQLKQLLMVGSIDRYFQVARCYRDEETQPDRQPEFTQMDIELSFTNRELIMSLIEDLLKASLSKDFTIQTPFPVIRYHEAMHWYGSDKPDISFDKKLIDISDLVVKDSLPENLKDIDNFTAKILVFDSSNEVQMKLKNTIQECENIQRMKGKNEAKLIMVQCTSTWNQDITENSPFVDAKKLKDTIEFPIPSTIVIGIGQENQVLPLMGKIRCEMFKKQTTDLQFAWIVDFPLFLQGDDGLPASVHHPFTQPFEEDVHLLKSNPYKVRGLHFDLVLNGHEVGGGSVRINDPVLQIEVLEDVLKTPTDSLQHLFDALDSGAPPHGGIALGIDRLLSILVKADSITDVIAFPKGVDGKDDMCGTPCQISEEERKLYHLIPRSHK